MSVADELLDQLEADATEKRNLFEGMCDVGQYCMAHGEEQAWGIEGNKKGPWAQRCEDIILDARFTSLRDALTSAMARTEDMRLRLKKHVTNEAVLFERNRLEGFMWCLEALYGPRDEFQHDMAREFHIALTELDFKLLERRDFGIGESPE